MLLDDSEDYKTTSPVEKGPWTTPSSWRGKGTPMDKFKGRLEDATTLKAGYLPPVEKVVSAHLGISLTAQGIVNYRKRLLAPAGSKNPRPYSPFPHMLRRVPHMLPAVARTIIRDCDVITRLYAVTVDMKCTLDDVTQRSPSKAGVKAERDEALDACEAALKQVALLKAGHRARAAVTQKKKKKKLPRTIFFPSTQPHPGAQ